MGLFAHVIVTAHAYVIIFFLILPVVIIDCGNFLIPFVLVAPDLPLLSINSNLC